MTGKYFFTDYVRNWIQLATFTDGSLNWISDVSEFAPINFGSGIVHMMQNPLNGFVYYANIFDGTLYRISFVGPAWSFAPSDTTVSCSNDPNQDLSNWLNSFTGTVSCGSTTITHDSDGMINCGESEVVTFTLSDECGNEISATATFTMEDTLSVSEFSLEKIVLYPNPSEGILTIKGLQSTAQLNIYSLTGQKVFYSEVENDKAFSINLHSGLYMVKIMTDQGTITKKLIIK